MKRKLVSIFITAMTVVSLTGCLGYYRESPDLPVSELSKDTDYDISEEDDISGGEVYEGEISTSGLLKPVAVDNESDEADILDDELLDMQFYATPGPIDGEEKLLYEAFLNGELKADVSEGEDMTLSEFIDSYEEHLIDEYFFSADDYFEQTETLYTYIDAGLDEKKELVVSQGYEKEGWDSIDAYFIFNINDGKVTLIDTEYTNSRGSIGITYSGIINLAGSGGANSHSYSELFITENGEKEFVYSVNFESALAKPLVPYYYIPSAIRPNDYPQDFSDAENYQCACYTFMELDESKMYSSEEMDNYYDSFFFKFSNMKAENVEPDESYKSFYDEHGIVYYTDAELDAVLTQREKELKLPQAAKEYKTLLPQYGYYVLDK